MNKFKMQVVYDGGKSLSITDSFDGMVSMVLTAEVLKEYEPLKIVFPGTGKILHFDKNLFHAYDEGGLHYSELIEQTSCDELYRNWLEIEAGDDIIEPGALWKLQGKELTLVDADRHITYLLNDEAFEIAK